MDARERPVSLVRPLASVGRRALESSLPRWPNVSESRVLARKMTRLAQHDFLAGLPNRGLLKEKLTQAIGLAQAASPQARGAAVSRSR
ncbi:hypothetical protein [Paludibacterium yongneupense]|uniref:hypothetical protein n=1 Tax=Paludibacterium yongneupense TaxID=400061 RepID=UPI001B7FD1D1|nr:hypothetical protein [Paludibacterium yongneupense]